MRKSQVLLNSDDLRREFDKCCSEYSTLHIAVAWCGNPDHALPFNSLQKFSGKITATIGCSFHHTHPDAFTWFKTIKADLRIFTDDQRQQMGLFHPKIYLFEDGQKYSLFIGSSNLTAGGFISNIESNVIISGNKISSELDIAELKETLERWRLPPFSFKPDKAWINKYQKQYAINRSKTRSQQVNSPVDYEELIGSANWLGHGNWELFVEKVHEGLAVHGRDIEVYHDVLNAAETIIPSPLNRKAFQDIEVRRVVSGLGDYAWLGRVAASGRFRKLLAGNDKDQILTICRNINALTEMQSPLDFKAVKRKLTNLEKLGSTIKVWSRVLCIIRPDLYCTIASEPVRRNLSATLELPASRFSTIDGYIQLLKFTHGSPWYNSPSPSTKGQKLIWERRMALIDAIFYEPNN